MTRFALLVALALLAGCATNWRQDLEARLTPLLGVSEDELIRRVGVPNRTAETGDRRFLAYEHRWADYAAAPVWGMGTGYWGAGAGFGWGWGGYAVPVERSCEITFELAGGRVSGFTLRGGSCGWTPWPQIAPA